MCYHSFSFLLVDLTLRRVQPRLSHLTIRYFRSNYSQIPMYSGLAIDITGSQSPGAYTKARLREQSISPLLSSVGHSGRPTAFQRGRSTSNASTSSSLSIVSPRSSSTNTSTTSLDIPSSRQRSQSRSRSHSPAIEETVRLGSEYVLAMHDYFAENPTCLSFRTGQVIHVLNRDNSGWWDGELEGRRGWFPSNYVNAELSSLIEEEPLGMKNVSNLDWSKYYRLIIPQPDYRRHAHSSSNASATSWTTVSSRTPEVSHNEHTRNLSSNSESLGQDVDPYCPPLMLPLLHGLSLLQSAVRTNRPAHFQPSTACIIGCVRSILASTETLQRDAPILQQFPRLTEERKHLLATLAALVAQSKKASESSLNATEFSTEVETMLRLGGQAFAHVRSFLTVAFKLGLEIPEEEEMSRTATPASEGSQAYKDHDYDDYDASPTKTPTQFRGRNPNSLPRLGSGLVGPRSRDNGIDSRSPTSNKSLARVRQEQYLLKDRATTRHKSDPSISSFSSTSSRSSESTPVEPPPFPCGPSTAAQVMEALRYTHDHYLSTIAAFIGHAHSHSRTSYASSTGVLYDLVKEIVEMVCKLLTIVEAVTQHPDVPANRVGNLKSAKEGLYNVTSTLAESVRLLTLSLPPTMSEEAEKQTLLRSATSALKAGADCVTAVKVCLTRSFGDRPFIVNLPSVDEVIRTPFAPLRLNNSTLAGLDNHVSSTTYRLNDMDDEDITIQAQTPSPVHRPREISSGSETSMVSRSSWVHSDDTRATSLDEVRPLPQISVAPYGSVERELASPTSVAHTDETGTTWEGSVHSDLGEKIISGEVPSDPLEGYSTGPDDIGWLYGHDYPVNDAAYNSEGYLVGATLAVLVEKMTPHDSIVDAAFSAIFFLTFRLFSNPCKLTDALVERFNLQTPGFLSEDDMRLWQQRKGIPVRLRVSNFVKTWVELYWRPGVDDVALPSLIMFTENGLAPLFPGPAARILELLEARNENSDKTVSPRADRTRDPGMSINPPTLTIGNAEIPRPTMTKALLASLRKRDFEHISITDFDALELARQLTVVECNLYCVIQPEEILESGQEGATPPLNVKAISSLSTAITGWVAESILNEPDIKKRTTLVKFFVKVADVRILLIY